MKIKIGKYKNWFGPYQLAEKLCFWVDKIEDEYGFKREPDWVHDFGEWLAYGHVNSKERKTHKLMEERDSTWIAKLLGWIDSKKQRKIDIQIDDYDTWSMDNTLALIIVPMLKQLRDTTHGYPMDFSTPDPESTTQLSFKDNGFEFPEETGHKQWQATIDKMIWAFEQVTDDNWEDQYRSGEIEFDCIPCEDSDHWELVKGAGDTSEVDYDGIRRHQDRMQEGFDLFGRHFRNLWD